MTSRLQHLLLAVLFAVGHLLAQPLALGGSCMGAASAGAECCCGTGMDAALGCGGCCEGAGGDLDQEPQEGEGDHGSCNCISTPPAPTAPERHQPGATSQVEGVELAEAEANFLHSSVWPDLSVPVAQPRPGYASRLPSRVTAAFSQVYRI